MASSIQHSPLVIPVNPDLRTAILMAQSSTIPFIQYREYGGVYVSRMQDIAEKIYLIACFGVESNEASLVGSLVSMNYSESISFRHIIPIPENTSAANIEIVNKATNMGGEYSEVEVTYNILKLVEYISSLALATQDPDQKKQLKDWSVMAYLCSIRLEPGIFDEEDLKEQFNINVTDLSPVCSMNATPLTRSGRSSSVMRPMSGKSGRLSTPFTRPPSSKLVLSGTSQARLQACIHPTPTRPSASTRSHNSKEAM